VENKSLLDCRNQKIEAWEPWLLKRAGEPQKSQRRDPQLFLARPLTAEPHMYGTDSKQLR